MAAAGDNGIGIAGACWNAKLTVLRHSGPDLLPTASSVIEVIDSVITEKEQGTDVVVLN